MNPNMQLPQQASKDLAGLKKQGQTIKTFAVVDAGVCVFFGIFYWWTLLFFAPFHGVGFASGKRYSR
jgi:hypothetical protein